MKKKKSINKKQRKKDKKSKESLRRYKLISENANDMIAILNDKYEYEYINEKTSYRIMGYKKGDVIGISALKFIHPNDLKKVMHYLKESYDIGKGRMQFRFKHKDGYWVWLESRGKTFLDIDGGKKDLIISRDISNQKELENELKERIKELTLINRLTKIIERNGSKLKEILQNAVKLMPSAFQFPEITCAMIFYNDIEYKTKNYKETKWGLSSKILINGEPVGTIKVYYIKDIGEFDKEPFLIEEKSLIRTFSTTLGTLLERIEMEKRLKKSKKKYQYISQELEEIIDAIPGLVFFKDKKNNYVRVNRYIAEAHNMSKQELEGTSCFSLYPKEEAQQYWEGDLEVIESGKPKLNIEEKWEMKEGRRWLNTSKIPYIDENGEIKGIIGISIDITERKKTEQLKDQLNKELEEKVKRRTIELQNALKKQKLLLEQISKASLFKSKFMAEMSHELRTPLNSIIGFTDLLLEGSYGSLNETQEEFLEDVKSSADHLLSLIKSIMDISKIESGEMELNLSNFSIKTMLNNIISEFEPSLNKKKLKIELHGIDENKKILADPIKLKSIFYNLISNAVKFTIEGRIDIIFNDKKDYWEFKIKDSGIGIAKEDFDTLFQEFKKVKTPYVSDKEGTGLGLPLSKKLIIMHGGEIKFESEEGKGTIFTFSIPKSPKEESKSKIQEFFKSL